MEGESAHVVDDVGHPGPAGGDAAEQPGFGGMGVDDVELLLAKQVKQVAIRPPVAQRPDRPIERGNGVPANCQPVELVGQRSRPLAGDVNLVARAVDLLEYLQHRSLHAAEDRQHLDMAQASHRGGVGFHWESDHGKKRKPLVSEKSSA